MSDRYASLALRESMQVMELSAMLTETLLNILKKNPEFSLHIVQATLKALAADTTMVGQLACAFQALEERPDTRDPRLN